MCTHSHQVSPTYLGYETVTTLVQRQVVSEFGFGGPAQWENAVEILRSAQYLFPEIPEVSTTPLYVRYNRSRAGSLQPGDVIPAGIRLTSVSNKRPVDLAQYCRDHVPAHISLVLVAGSYT